MIESSHPRSATAGGIAWMLLSMLLFACLDAGIKILAQGYSAQQILAVRFVVFLVVVAAWIGPDRLRSAARSQAPLFQVGRALVLLLEMGVFVVAIRLLPLGDVHAVAAATPLIVTALAWPLLGERVGPRRWAAVAMGMLGLLIVVRPGLATDPAMLVPLLGAFLWALYQIMLRHVSRRDGSDTTALTTALVGLAVTGSLAPFDWTAPDARGWLLLLLVAAFGAGAHLALIRALALAPASVVQPFTYSLVVWATLLGFLLFDDVPDALTLLGAAIIVASGLYAWASDRREKT